VLVAAAAAIGVGALLEPASAVAVASALASDPQPAEQTTRVDPRAPAHARLTHQE